MNVLNVDRRGWKIRFLPLISPSGSRPSFILYAAGPKFPGWIPNSLTSFALSLTPLNKPNQTYSRKMKTWKWSWKELRKKLFTSQMTLLRQHKKKFPHFASIRMWAWYAEGSCDTKMKGKRNFVLTWGRKERKKLKILRHFSGREGIFRWTFLKFSPFSR